MDKEWQCVYISDKNHLVEIAKAILKENGIESQEINKKDSTYITVGDIELYVRNEDVMLSKIILEQNKL